MISKLLPCESSTLTAPNQRIPPSHAPVIPLYLRNILSGASLIVHGDGRQTRDFVYIEDVVDALITAALAPDVNGAILNIGSGQETSINEVIAALGAVVGRQPEVIYNPKQSGGLDRLVANLQHAQRTPRLSAQGNAGGRIAPAVDRGSTL